MKLASMLLPQTQRSDFQSSLLSALLPLLPLATRKHYPLLRSPLLLLAFVPALTSLMLLKLCRLDYARTLFRPLFLFRDFVFSQNRLQLGYVITKILLHLALLRSALES